MAVRAAGRRGAAGRAAARPGGWGPACEASTILLVEQNARQALRVVERCYVLEAGEVVFTGTPADLAREPLLTKAYLGTATPR